MLVFLALARGAGAPGPTDFGAIDSIFGALADRKSPGFAVLIRKDGQNVFERGYGVRELRTLARIDEKTNFRLASVSKQFTAMAIMLLARDGKLRYDEALTDIFPDFPAYGKTVTIRHLLTHTSGIPDYENVMEQRPIWTAERQIQDDEVLELLKRQSRPVFAAGTSWAYSNSAYVMLGLIVAKVSGVGFPQFLEQRIFRPLHMSGTVAYVSGKNAVANRAFGHTRRGDSFVESDQSSTSGTLGDGGIYSNLEDLAKWDAALQKGSLLSPREMQIAWAPARLADGSETRWPLDPSGDNLNPGKPVVYGFGWFLDPYQGHARMWHTGTTMGFRTMIERFPADRLSIIILCNRTDRDTSQLAQQVAAILLPN